MPSDLLNTAEVAQRLDVDRSTVARWGRDGKHRPALKLDGLRQPAFFHPDEVDRFAAERGTAA